MGDDGALEGTKQTMCLLSITSARIPTLRKAIIGILASRLVWDKGKDNILYCWASIIM